MMDSLYALSDFVSYQIEYQRLSPVPVVFGLFHFRETQVELMSSTTMFLGSDGGSRISGMSSVIFLLMFG